MNRSSGHTVLLTNFYGDLGGGEFALLDHARRLLVAGVRVHVWLFHDGPFREALVSAGCDIRVFRQRLDCGPRGAAWVAMRLVPRLAWLLRSLRPRYVVTYTHHEMPFVLRAAQLAGIPAAFRDQGRPRANLDATDWGRQRLPVLCRRPGTWVLPTTTGQAAFLAEIGVARECIRQVYLGVDRQRYGAGPDTASQIKAEWAIPRGAPVVGIVGRLVALKGHPVLLQAIQRTERRDVHVLVVGGAQLNDVLGADYLQQLKRLVGDLGIAGRVHFTGFRADVPRLISACDVVCSASEWETFGLSLVEAMMCGKPVIATDVSGPREIVVPGESGYLYPVGDSDALARHLDHLLSDPARARQMGAAGRQRALEKFDQERNLDELDRVIHEMLSLRSPEVLTVA